MSIIWVIAGTSRMLRPRRPHHKTFLSVCPSKHPFSCLMSSHRRHTYCWSALCTYSTAQGANLSFSSCPCLLDAAEFAPVRFDRGALEALEASTLLRRSLSESLFRVVFNEGITGRVPLSVLPRIFATGTCLLGGIKMNTSARWPRASPWPGHRAGPCQPSPRPLPHASPCRNTPGRPWAGPGPVLGRETRAGPGPGGKGLKGLEEK